MLCRKTSGQLEAAAPTPKDYEIQGAFVTNEGSREGAEDWFPNLWPAVGNEAYIIVRTEVRMNDPLVTYLEDHKAGARLATRKQSISDERTIARL